MRHVLPVGWQVLSAADRRTLLVLTILQPLVSGSLRISGYAKTQRRLEWLSRHQRQRPCEATDLEQAGQLARLAAIAGRRSPIKTTCLRQALAIYFLLRRKGLAPSIKFGVAHLGGQHEMHAWVELGGTMLDPTAKAYASFDPTQD